MSAALVVVIHPEQFSERNLFKVVDAANASRPCLRFGQSGQEKRCQNVDNRDHDEQFNERKGTHPFPMFIHTQWCWVSDGIWTYHGINVNDAGKINLLQCGKTRE